eukprot:PhF_6_TR36382/c0_g1_i1/m.53463
MTKCSSRSIIFALFLTFVLNIILFSMYFRLSQTTDTKTTTTYFLRPLIRLEDTWRGHNSLQLTSNPKQIIINPYQFESVTTNETAKSNNDRKQVILTIPPSTTLPPVLESVNEAETTAREKSCQPPAFESIDRFRMRNIFHCKRRCDTRDPVTQEDATRNNNYNRRFSVLGGWLPSEKNSHCVEIGLQVTGNPHLNLLLEVTLSLTSTVKEDLYATCKGWTAQSKRCRWENVGDNHRFYFTACLLRLGKHSHLPYRLYVDIHHGESLFGRMRVALMTTSAGASCRKAVQMHDVTSSITQPPPLCDQTVSVTKSSTVVISAMFGESIQPLVLTERSSIPAERILFTDREENAITMNEWTLVLTPFHLDSPFLHTTSSPSLIAKYYKLQVYKHLPKNVMFVIWLDLHTILRTSRTIHTVRKLLSPLNPTLWVFFTTTTIKEEIETKTLRYGLLSKLANMRAKFGQRINAVLDTVLQFIREGEYCPRLYAALPSRWVFDTFPCFQSAIEINRALKQKGCNVTEMDPLTYVSTAFFAYSMKGKENAEDDVFRALMESWWELTAKLLDDSVALPLAIATVGMNRTNPFIQHTTPWNWSEENFLQKHQETAEDVARQRSCASLTPRYEAKLKQLYGCEECVVLVDAVARVPTNNDYVTYSKEIRAGWSPSKDDDHCSIIRVQINNESLADETEIIKLTAKLSEVVQNKVLNLSCSGKETVGPAPQCDLTLQSLQHGLFIRVCLSSPPQQDANETKSSSTPPPPTAVSYRLFVEFRTAKSSAIIGTMRIALMTATAGKDCRGTIVMTSLATWTQYHQVGGISASHRLCEPLNIDSSVDCVVA